MNLTKEHTLISTQKGTLRVLNIKARSPNSGYEFIFKT